MNIFDTFRQILKEFEFLQDIISTIILFLPKLIASFFVLVISYLFYRLVRYILVRSMKNADVSTSIINMLTKVIKYTLLGLAIILVADQIGIKIVTILSTLGVAGIAIGLAAQQTLANFISGIIILMNKPFKENDIVELENTFGIVKQITLRSTTLITFDNLLVDIPNHKILESKIINHTYNEYIRIRIPVGIAYKEDIPTAQHILREVVRNDDRFLEQPEPEVVVTQIAESSINLELLVWIKDPRKEIRISYDLKKKVKLALDEAGIQIPFPHLQVFIDDININHIKELIDRKNEEK